MERLDSFEVDGDTMKALVLQGCSAHTRGPDKDLTTLAELRALQIHSDKTGHAERLGIARKQPMLASRVAELSTWPESKLFSAREGTALSWIEAGADVDMPDPVCEDAARHFRDDESTPLTVAIVSASAWTRTANAFRLDRQPI